MHVAVHLMQLGSFGRAVRSLAGVIERVLLRMGFTRAHVSARLRELLPHDFTLASDHLRLSQPCQAEPVEARGGMFLWHFPSSCPDRTLSCTLPCEARTFLTQNGRGRPAYSATGSIARTCTDEEAARPEVSEEFVRHVDVQRVVQDRMEALHVRLERSVSSMMRQVAFSLALVLTLSACQGGHVTNSVLPLTHAALSATNAAFNASVCPVVLAAQPYAPAYANTTWPSEHHDVWRTHAVAAGLPARIRGLQAESAMLPPVPVWGYVGIDGNLYVLGGAPYLLDVFTKLILGAPQSAIPVLVAESLRYSQTVTPYVARIDPKTMAVTTLSLTKAVGVNYTGGMLIDSNGYLYADARSVLYKIDPKTFTVVLSKDLPLAPKSSGEPNFLTAYNGMQATTDGDLILKGFPSLGGSAGIMLKVDPTDFSTRARFVSKQIASPRMVVATSQGQQYVYFPGVMDSMRILIGARSFSVDDAFSRRYLFPNTGDTAASSDAFMGQGVVFANNTDPTATSPIKIFAQGASDGSPLASAPAFSAITAGWNFFMVAGDPFQTGIVAVQNQVDGHISGFRVCSGGTDVKKLWENDSIDGSAGMAINDATGQLYADDHHCVTRIKCMLFFVVLDLRTGRELARVRVAGDEPSMGQIFIGPQGRVFYLATDTDKPNGYITRITAR